MFTANGIKIINEIQGVIDDYKHQHKRQPKKQGFHTHLKAQSHFFDPHNEARNIEHHEYIKYITHALEKFLQEHGEYKKIIVVAEAKMLGEFRKNFKRSLHSIIAKEVVGNLLHIDRKNIEKIVFK
jgi:protein required for attachment to host cells